MSKKQGAVLGDITDLLVDKACKILEWRYIEATLPLESMRDEKSMVKAGLPGDYYNYDQAKLQQFVDMVRPLIKDSQQTRKLNAQTSADIAKAVRLGKMSIDDALKMMNLVQKKIETEGKEIQQKINNKISDMIDETE